MRAPDLNEYPSKLFLTGFMGAGKSAVGPRLARRLTYAFIDTDAEVVRRVGISIPEIFSTLGEMEFRRVETEVIGDLMRREKIVVALGGGALMKEENRSTVLATGAVIYLRAGVETLTERLRVTDRPLVREYSGAALKNRVSEMLLSREPVYRLAQFTVDTDHQSVEAVVDEICGRMRSGED